MCKGSAFGPVLALAVFLGGAGAAMGDTLAYYPFDEGTTTNSTAANNWESLTAMSVDTNPNSTASLLTAGVGIWGPNATQTFGNNAVSTTGGNPIPSIYSRASVTTNSLAGAIAGNDYFTFTITPDPGHAMNLQSLSFDHARNVSDYISQYAILSSIDDFTSALGTSTLTGSTPGNDVFANFFLDLSADPNFQDLMVPVEFRLYAFDSSSADNRINRLDNVLLEGEVFLVPVIPEPRSLALFLLVGAVGLAWAWRRRREVWAAR